MRGALQCFFFSPQPTTLCSELSLVATLDTMDGNNDEKVRYKSATGLPERPFWERLEQSAALWAQHLGLDGGVAV